ncbi:MAG: transposase [Candidatus Buchananbacteria bacterium]|nr:transposase [Candidatus Buchananbacteria bacterium]
MLKRFNLENQIYFITSKTFDNEKIFSDDRSCRLFIEVLNECKDKYGFELFGYVIMPDHIHLLIKPNPRNTISDVMHRIKGSFAYKYLMMTRNHKGSATRENGINKPTLLRMSQSQLRVADPSWVGEKRQRIKQQPIWQKSFYDHAIRNHQDFLEKLNYIHKNPLKHNIANDLNQYQYSSYQNYYLSNNNLTKIDEYEI